MRTTRFYLLLGMALLVVLALTGCQDSNTPRAVFTASMLEKVIPFNASFDGALSYDSNGKIISYIWDFGDNAAGSGAQVTHEYKEDGVYIVKLTVTDNQGISNSSSITVCALNPLPVGSFSYDPKSMMAGEYIAGASEWITFDASESTDDGEITSYHWNFGDGWKDDGEVVKHRYLWAGIYSVALTITDNDGGKTIYVQPVTILGGPPCYPDIDGWDAGGYK
jgi:PKD repeat protein